MLIVIARVQARPDQAEALADLLGALPAASRRDPGCTSYAVSRDLEDDTRFSTLETWDSRADLDAHLSAPHTAELLSRLPGLVAAPPTIHAHEVSSTDQVA